MTVKVPSVIQRLRQGKQTLRNARRSLSLPEKVEQVVKLQEIELKIISLRRELKPWERAWPLSRDQRTRRQPR